MKSLNSWCSTFHRYQWFPEKRHISHWTKVSRSYTFLFKKADPFDKSNYQSVSLLSRISKVFERIIYNQISEYIEPFLSKVLTGFSKNHNAQHFLLKNLEKFKETLDGGNSVCTIFKDLSKKFDTSNDDLLIARVEVCCFSSKLLSYIHSNLNKRLQKVIVILVHRNKCSHEFLKDLFLVYIYSIYILMTLSFL